MDFNDEIIKILEPITRKQQDTLLQTVKEQGKIAIIGQDIKTEHDKEEGMTILTIITTYRVGDV